MVTLIQCTSVKPKTRKSSSEYRQHWKASNKVDTKTAAMADAEMAEPGHDAIALPPTTSTRSSLVPEDGNSITTSSTTLALTRSKKTPAKRNQKSMKGSGANRTPKSAKLSPNKVTKRKPKPSKAKVDKEGKHI
jgi:hypothetical protein